MVLGIKSKLTGFASKASTVLGAAYKLKLLNKVTVILGLTGQIIISVLESAATLNPATWMIETGQVFFNINTTLINLVNTLQEGTGNFRALQITMTIWGLLWVQYFAIKIFTRIAQETFSGHDTPTLPAYGFTAIFVLGPVQLLGAVLMTGITQGTVEITTKMIPYSGLYYVMVNSGLWIEPLSWGFNQITQHLPTELLTNKVSNNTNASVQTLS
jgi:hypothetical protein